MAAVLMCSAGPAFAARTADMLGLYNADRTANGLPAVTAINPAMETGCANHLHYMALNHSMDHGEDPSKPGYTPQGDYLDGAGGGEVLAAMPGWLPGADPWSSAPIHLYFMFDPSVQQIGYADGEGYSCMRMRGPDFAPDPTSPLPSVFYAWTGDAGRKNVAPSEQAGEAPYIPQQLVGIPASQATGPNILLFSLGDQGVPVSATLVGPGGAVRTALVNVNTKNSIGDGGWFLGGGVLIPVKPLKPLSTYTATVQWDDNGPQTQTFSFTTGRRMAQNLLDVQVDGDKRGRTRITIHTFASAAHVELSGPGGQTLTPRLHHNVTGWLRLARGHWQACGASGGEPDAYLPTTGCQAFVAGRSGRVG